MHSSQQLVALVAVILSTVSLTSPVQILGKNIGYNGPKAVMSPYSWDELKFDHYLTSWKAKNFPAYCKKDEAWSICFRPIGHRQRPTRRLRADKLHKVRRVRPLFPLSLPLVVLRGLQYML